ncbi:MAG: beta-ketoacyl reductase, partial [Cyanobacteria bacterium P01_E01_bin.34]
VQRGCGSVFCLLQALLRRTWQHSPRIWLVTRGVADLETTSPSIAQATLWGVGRVMSLEHPENWGGLIDLSPHEGSGQLLERDAEQLLSVLVDPEEDQVAFRGSHCYVARLMHPSPRQKLRSLPNLTEGTYLVTGGLGALGLRVAQWLVELGAKQLVLTGRRGPSPQAQVEIDRFEKLGTQILVASVDVTDVSGMASLFDRVSKTCPPLKGIIHAAGVPGYQPMESIDRDTLLQVLRPKIVGTCVLHDLTQELDLDFFVLFSSIAAIWGSKGQAHYAAANAFLDSFADYRRSLGLPALSLSWGPWARGGMTSDEAQVWLSRMGIHALEPDLAIAALDYALRGLTGRVTVASVDWSIFKGLYEARGRRPLLALLQPEPASEVTETTVSNSAFIESLLQSPQAMRHRLLVTHLQQAVGKVLGFSAAQMPAPSQGFFDMGMDSLTAIELKSQLEKSLGISLPATLAFEAPTIADLARYLEASYLPQASISSETEPLESDTENSMLLELADSSSDSLVTSPSDVEDAIVEDETSVTEKLDQLEALLRGL